MTCFGWWRVITTNVSTKAQTLEGASTSWMASTAATTTAGVAAPTAAAATVAIPAELKKQCEMAAAARQAVLDRIKALAAKASKAEV